IVVMRPCSTPNASSSTLTMGTKQFVVHDAFEITLWTAGSKSPSFTPMTKVASAPFDGADTITNGAPAPRCWAAFARSVNNPVDSTTTSTPSSPHGNAFGSRISSTRNVSPSTEMPPLATATCASSLPRTESYLRRWAMVSIEPRSFTATKSRSAPASLAARKKFRPIRPNPLTPTRIAMRRPYPRRPLTPHIAVLHTGVMALAPQPAAQLLGDSYRSMPAARASQRDRQVALALGHIRG